MDVDNMTMKERREILAAQRNSMMDLGTAAAAQFSSSSSIAASTPALTMTSNLSDEDSDLSDIEDVGMRVASSGSVAIAEHADVVMADDIQSAAVIATTAETPDVAMADAPPVDVSTSKRMRKAPVRLGYATPTPSTGATAVGPRFVSDEDIEAMFSDGSRSPKRKTKRLSQPAAERKLAVAKTAHTKAQRAAGAPTPAPKPKPAKRQMAGMKRKRDASDDEELSFPPPKSAKEFADDDAADMAHGSDADAEASSPTDNAMDTSNVPLPGTQSPIKAVATGKSKAASTRRARTPKTPKTPKTPRVRKPREPKAKDDDTDATPKTRTPKQKGITLPTVALFSDLDAETDPELLALSRRLCAREPVGKKPQPVGQPTVWASGRTELIETTSYFRSSMGGCYAYQGTAFGFLRDACGSAREYMDQDVIISRAGGQMGNDKDTGEFTQVSDHDLNHAQVQAVMNNIQHETPVYIICGNRCGDSPSAMPHKYNVLGCYKITHMWQEKNVGEGGQEMMTIKYRFERLNTSLQPWHAPVGAVAETATSQQYPLVVQQCNTCCKESPQVYVQSWSCLHSDCDDFWMRPDGIEMPLGHLDFHPGFLLHRTRWPVEIPPFDESAHVPLSGEYAGAHLAYAHSKGVNCEKCGRCCNRYIYDRWQCDAPGCGWSHEPEVTAIQPAMNSAGEVRRFISDGPGLGTNVVEPNIAIKIAYFRGFKIIRYTLKDGSYVYHCKSNRAINAIPGGPDDMFRELQLAKMGLKRRPLKKRPMQLLKKSAKQEAEIDLDGSQRMVGFTGNYGMGYKFVGIGETKSFAEAPDAVKRARSVLSWACRTMSARLFEPRTSTDPEDAAYDLASLAESQEILEGFNELMVVGYRVGGKMGWHSDDEKGLRPAVATLSLGGSSDFLVKMKKNVFCQRGEAGTFLDEKPVSLAALRAAGYGDHARETEESYNIRVAAYEKLQVFKSQNLTKTKLKEESCKLWKSMGIRCREPKVMLTAYLTHGDIIIMQGVQDHYFHTVHAMDELRFALTCRFISAEHFGDDQDPANKVEPDHIRYDGAALEVFREPGQGECAVWD